MLPFADHPQGLDNRFKPAAAAFLIEVLNGAVTELIVVDAVADPLLQRFSAVEALDGSDITPPPELAKVLRGCGGSTAEGDNAVKIEVRLDLFSEALQGHCFRMDALLLRLRPSIKLLCLRKPRT